MGAGREGDVWNMLNHLPHGFPVAVVVKKQHKPFQSVSTKASPQTLEKNT